MSYVEAIGTNVRLKLPDQPLINRADGCWLYSTEGYKYFDASAGSGAVNLGHQHPQLLDIISQQSKQIIHTGWNIACESRENFIETLGRFSPYIGCSILPAVSGAEAVEAAIKIARAHNGRRSVISFEHGFHGKTEGALMATWRDSFRSYSFIRDPDAMYRLPSPSGDNIESCKDALSRKIEFLAKKNNLPAAIIIEPIQVAEGVHMIDSGFLAHMIAVCKSYEIVSIFDEIYTGFGRSGSPFYCSSYSEGKLPDLMLVGKSMTNGFPMSAVIGKSYVVDSLPYGVHSSTFSGSPLASSLAIKVIEIMEETKPWLKASTHCAVIVSHINDIRSKFSWVGEIRHAGLLVAFDCLDQRGGPCTKTSGKFIEIALRKRLLLRGGGIHGATIKFTPPLVINKVELEFFLKTLTEVFELVSEDRALSSCR